ncbi:MAG: lipase [Actinobacteria bacterium]|nr:lipase [Actinomycetota bacterium]
MRRRAGIGATAAAAAVLVAVLPAAAPAAGKGARDPALTVPTATLARAFQCPHPLGRHGRRNAVLLVHGTGTNPEDTWGWSYLQSLPRAGFRACTVRLPDQALGDIQTASEYVVYAIRRMARLTGRKVDVIGHSQGTLEPRWAIRWWPRTVRPVVDDYISLAGPHHGIVGADACVQSGNCWPAVWQMATHSRFLAALNAGDETPGRISYTSVFSDTDELVQPSEPIPTAALSGASNVRIQDVCPGRPVHHVGELDDAVVWAVVLDALTHPGPAKVSRLPADVCTRQLVPGETYQSAAQGNWDLYSHAAQAFAQHPGVRSEPQLRPYAQRR